MALSIKELQIGDFVMYNGCFACVYSVQSPLPRRDRLSDKNVITLFLNGLIDASEDEIEPIPLTQEILENNGFKVPIFASILNPELLQFALPTNEFVPSKFITRNISDNFFMMNDFIQIKYVHELQNALRLCGLNELADNFKI